jgi:hypothetical protein
MSITECIPYPPHTPAYTALVHRDISSQAGLASYAHRIGE